MKCLACGHALGKLNAAGEPMIRAKGLVLKADGPVMICPRCSGDVQFTAEIAKALSTRLFIFPRPATPKPKR